MRRSWSQHIDLPEDHGIYAVPYKAGQGIDPEFFKRIADGTHQHADPRKGEGSQGGHNNDKKSVFVQVFLILDEVSPFDPPVDYRLIQCYPYPKSQYAGTVGYKGQQCNIVNISIQIVGTCRPDKKDLRGNNSEKNFGYGINDKDQRGIIIHWFEELKVIFYAYILLENKEKGDKRCENNNSSHEVSEEE
jgi:hypothetical protein